MNVQGCMRTDAVILSPDTGIEEAVRSMRDCGAGVVLIEENDLLIGIVTEADIATRDVAVATRSNATIRDIMTAEVRCCFDDEDLGAAAARIGELHVWQMPVLNRYNRLVGLLSVDDISRPGAERAETGPSDVVERARAYQMWETIENSHGGTDRTEP